MQLEFANIYSLVSKSNSNNTPNKPAFMAVKTPINVSNQQKHIAEQFEFPFVRQFSEAKPGFTGSAKPSLPA